MYLSDFAAIATPCRGSGHGFEAFRQNPIVMDLGWPDDVLEQWLYDHADNGAFLNDYGTVDLSRVHWDVEAVSTDELAAMPTGPSDRECIEEYADNPSYWIQARTYGVHVGVALCWDVHGTWKRWPILLDRMLVDPWARGLQVVEGRTRVGVLRGRRREGGFVAENHLAWVGRPST